MQTGQMVIMALQFVLSIVVARTLGVQQAGLYAITLTIVGTLGLITDMGQNYSLLTLLPESYGKNDKKAVEDALAYFAQIAIWWVLPIVTALCVFTPKILTMFYPGHDIGLWVRLGLLTLLLLPIHDFVTLTLQGTRHIKALTITEIVFGLFEFLAPVAFLFLWEFSVTALMVGRLTSTILKVSVSLLLWRMFLTKEALLPRARAVARSALKNFHFSGLKLGLWISFDRQFGKFIVQTPIYILGILGSASLVGQYKYLMSYVGISSTLVGSIGRLMTSVLPMIYTKNIKKFNASFWKGNIASMLLTYATLIPLLILGNRGITFLYGPEFAVPSVVFWILIPLGLNGLTVGFGSYYRIHRALHLMIWLQLMSTAVGLLLFWHLYQLNVSVFVATVAYATMYATMAKVGHIVNFAIIKKKRQAA